MASEVTASQSTLPVYEDRAGVDMTTERPSEGPADVEMLEVNDTNGEVLTDQQEEVTAAATGEKGSKDRDHTDKEATNG